MFLFFCYVIDTIRINSSRPSHLNEQRQRTIVRALQMVSTTGQDGLSWSKSKQGWPLNSLPVFFLESSLDNVFMFYQNLRETPKQSFSRPTSLLKKRFPI